MYFQTSLTPILVMPLSYQMCIHSRSPVSTFRQATVTNAGTPSSGFTREILMGEGFIIYGRGAWFAITTLYETKTHTDYYCQVAFHKLASIKFFDKNPNDATINIFPTNSSLPSVTTSTSVRLQKRWMNASVLCSLIPY